MAKSMKQSEDRQRWLSVSGLRLILKAIIAIAFLAAAVVFILNGLNGWGVAMLISIALILDG